MLCFALAETYWGYIFGGVILDCYTGLPQQFYAGVWREACDRGMIFGPKKYTIRLP